MNYDRLRAALIATNLAIQEQLPNGRTPDSQNTLNLAEQYGKRTCNPGDIGKVMAVTNFERLESLLKEPT